MAILILLLIALPLAAAIIKRIPLIICLAAETALAVLIACLDITPIVLPEILGGLRLILTADTLAKGFGILICGMWLLVGIYSRGYMEYDDRRKSFDRFYSLTLSAMLLLVYAGNFFTLLVGFEAMTLLSMPMVLHDRTEAAKKAAIKYLGFSIFGATLALICFLILSAYGESTDFTVGGSLKPMTDHNQAFVAAWLLAVVGFGAKAGLVPLHSWLPVAHPEAPSPASAVLSGVITKCGVFAMIRVTYYIFSPEQLHGTWAQYTAMTLALVTVFVGSMMALGQEHIKKRLAYSTVSQVAYAVYGLTLLEQSGLAGALLQIAFHMLAKDALFMWAGAVIHYTEITSANDMRDLGRRMPCAMWVFTLASLSLIGIPPAGGFVSKFMLADGSLSFDNSVFGIIGVTVLIISALLTAAYLLPITAAAFFPGKDVYKSPAERVPVDKRMLAPMLVSSVLAVILGIFPKLITGLFGL